MYPRPNHVDERTSCSFPSVSPDFGHEILAIFLTNVVDDGIHVPHVGELHLESVYRLSVVFSNGLCVVFHSWES